MSAKGTAASQTAPGERRNAPPPCILVVDDEEQTVLALAVVLGQAGYAVSEARNGAEALQAIAGRDADRPFAAILLDLHMPTMDGTAVLRVLQDVGDPTPVILMSGYGPGVLAQAAGSQRIAVLAKPFTPDMALAAVVRATGVPAAGSKPQRILPKL